MVDEVLSYLALAPRKTVVDVTVGCGQHARRLLQAVLPGGLLIGIDRDPQMIRMARAALSPFPPGSYRLVEANYSALDEVLRQLELDAVDAIFLDAGFSSAQMDDPERGFSYRGDGPLDMRYSPDAVPAATLVNELSAAELEQLFREYGEERWSRRIAARIARARMRQPILRTGQLAEVIVRALPAGRRRRHPARRCFQALRIAVNRELEHLEKFLASAPNCLRLDARIVTLCYHSLEDRLVKHAFRAGERAGLLRTETRRVVRPRAGEVARNPRSRSARLRAATRISPARE